MDDLEEVVAAVSSARAHDLGETDIGVDAMKAEWLTLDLPNETVIVRHPDAGIVAYAEVYNRDDVVISVYGDVLPEWRSNGLGGYLVDWGEVLAARRLPHAEPGVRVCLRHYIVESDLAGIDLVSGRGYLPVRRIDVMRIDLAESGPREIRMPDSIRLERFRPGIDERASFDAIEDAFSEMWGRPPGSFDEFLQTIASPAVDPELILMAWDGDEVAGQAWASIADGEGWIDAVAVRRPWRRRGLATALLETLFNEFVERGITRAELSVDSESTSKASDVYLGAGMHRKRAYVALEKTVRDGVDPAPQPS